MFACPPKNAVDMFDQNGYDLTKLRTTVCCGQWLQLPHDTGTVLTSHSANHWFTADDTEYGPHINHAYMFERKGYSGDALNQLGKLGGIQTTLPQTDCHEAKVGTGLQHRLL